MPIPFDWKTVKYNYNTRRLYNDSIIVMDCGAFLYCVGISGEHLLTDAVYRGDAAAALQIILSKTKRRKEKFRID